jgi:hypothetical protein
MAERDGQTVSELLDGLSAKTRKTLAHSGFDMPRLRELAATAPGEKQVRHIVTEFGLRPALPFTPEAGAITRREVAIAWTRTLVGVLLGLAAIMTASILVDRLLGLFVGVLAGMGVMALLLTGPQSRGRELAALVGLTAVAVLYFTAFMNAPQWYLAVRGKQVSAVLQPPLRTWSHGSRVAHCRVRLPDGTVHRVDQDNGTCASSVGATVPVVYDPHHRLAPALGRKATLGRLSRPVAGTSAALLLAAAGGAVLAAGRRGGI